MSSSHFKCVESSLSLQRVHIPLPDEPARSHMVRAGLKGVDHKLVDSDIQQLAKMTAGFSGSDVAVLMKGIMMEPVRLAHCATSFRSASPHLTSCFLFEMVQHGVLVQCACTLHASLSCLLCDFL